MKEKLSEIILEEAKNLLRLSMLITESAEQINKKGPRNIIYGLGYENLCQAIDDASCSIKSLQRLKDALEGMDT